jgi:hypothetical protein
MKQVNRHYVESLVSVRRNSLEVIALAVVLALGINLASSGLPSALSLTPEVTTGIGIALTCLALIYLGVRLRPLRSQTLDLSGVLLTSADNAVEEIERYQVAEKFHSYFVGLTSENKALSRLWRESNLGPQITEDGVAARLATSQGNQLVCEAIEYFVLDKLSLHLSEYFDSNRAIEEHTIVRVQRTDIPHILLQNRFLELFSKPMEMREAFMGHCPSKDGHKVVYAMGKDGAFFDHFELILPKGSSVSRSDAAGLRIATSRFNLTIKPVFLGFSDVLPHKFEELYLGKQFGEVDAYIMGVELHVQFKWWAFMTGKGWDYYEWLDSFLDQLTAAFSFEDFISAIGWEATVSVVIANENRLANFGKNAATLPSRGKCDAAQTE